MKNKFFDFLNQFFEREDSGLSFTSIRYTSALSEVPNDTGSFIYIIKSGSKNKWAVFKCPNNCGKRIEINLMKSIHPSWNLSLKKKKVTLYPSVVMETCGAHFWIEENRVIWAREVED